MSKDSLLELKKTNLLEQLDIMCGIQKVPEDTAVKSEINNEDSNDIVGIYWIQKINLKIPFIIFILKNLLIHVFFLQS